MRTATDLSIHTTPGLRIAKVLGDSMEPRLRSDLDYIMIRPCTTFEGDGMYMLHNGGGLAPYYVDYLFGEAKVRLRLENPRYQGCECTLDQFEERVAGRVVAEVTVLDPMAIEQAGSSR